MKKVLVFLILILAGCARPMTMREKVLFGGMLAAQAADYETTRRGVGAGMTEINPLLDDHPSREQITLLKIGAVGVLYLLGELQPDHREFLFSIGIVSGGGAAIWNDTLYDRRPE